jgi:hypothetical protein
LQCGLVDNTSPTPCIIRGQGVNAGTSNGNGVSTTLLAGPGTGSGTSGSVILSTGSSVSDAGTAHTITAFSGSASPYTITATGTTAYPVGGFVTIAGASPSSLNGSYTVTASSAGSFTATTTQTGTWTSGGTATYSATQQNPAVTALSIAGAVGSTPGVVSIPNLVSCASVQTNSSGATSCGSATTPAEVLISEVITSGSQTSVTFTPPVGYRDLIIKVAGISTNPGGGDFITVTFNGDTGSNYYYARFGYSTSGANFGSAVNAANYAILGAITGEGGGYTPNAAGYAEGVIASYGLTTFFKTISSKSTGSESPGVYGDVSFGRWSNTAAITSVTIATGTGSAFVNGSVVSLYARH